MQQSQSLKGLLLLHKEEAAIASHGNASENVAIQISLSFIPELMVNNEGQNKTDNVFSAKSRPMAC